MLASGVISLGIKFRIATPLQRLCASIKMSSTSSGSSSDSSSDSDSDTESVQNMKKKHNSTKKTESLNGLIDSITEQNTNTKTINVAMPLRENIRKQQSYMKKTSSYEKQISKALENVTNALGRDKENVKSQLLDRLSLMHKGNTKTKKQYSSGGLNKLVKQMGVENRSKSIREQTKQNDMESQKSFISVSRQLLEEQMTKQKRHTVNSKETSQNYIKEQYQAEQKDLNTNLQFQEDYTIFKNIRESATDVPELPVWKSLEQRELALISNQSPRNYFQEMIQWTESGKLWTFPIDNEYGMQHEYNVHFSEHVFLERHLKDWCPKRGPIRHYMELVCVGLSKNPYMSVDEKIGHITWYKEYFKGKEEILKELGAIDVETNMKEQTKI